MGTKKVRPSRSRRKRELWYSLGQRRCHCCGVQMTWDNKNTDRSATVDHLVPRSQGGTFHYANILILCYKCNYKRGDTHWPTFVKRYNLPKAEWLLKKYLDAIDYYGTQPEIPIKLGEN